MTVSWRFLSYFVAVVEEGQITSAAARLNVAQPAISQGLAQLEAELGVTLLERHPRGVRPTPAGQAFLERARQALRAAEEAELTAFSLARAQEGVLELGFLGAPPSLHSPDLLDAFTDRHPGVELHFAELQFPDAAAAEWLAAVDAAIAVLPPADDSVWHVPLRRERRVVLAPASHRLASARTVTVAEVIDETFIGHHERAEPTWAGFWTLDDHRGGPPTNVSSDAPASTQELFALLGASTAITTVPARHAALVSAIVPGLASVPLADAHPVEFVLAGRNDKRGPLVNALASIAAALQQAGAQAAGSPPGAEGAGDAVPDPL